jgi:Protein of unknown function (DUF3225)
MKFSWMAGVLLILVGIGPLSAQQPSTPTAALEIDVPQVVAEVKAAHAAYNQALNSGNIAVQNGTFRNDERTIRYGGAENLYGYKAIESFRTTARPIDPAHALQDGDNHLWPRLRRNFNSHASCQPARQGRSPDADLG